MLDLSKLSEKGLLRYLAGDLTHFSNAFRFIHMAALGFYEDSWDLECHFSVTRTELGLASGKKPGDIDVLLIPVLDDDRFAERSMAVEAKRFVLPPHRRDRSPDNYGSDQVNGLVEDGFPFVGLLHIPIVQQSPREEWVELPMFKGLTAAGEYEFEGSFSLDPAVDQVTLRHEGRVDRMSIPESVGYNIFSIHLSAEQNRIEGYSMRSWRKAQKSPHVSKELVATIRELTRRPDCTISFRNGGGTVANYNASKLE